MDTIKPHSHLQRKFEGCIIGGAIGDAWGSSYENISDNRNSNTFYLGQKNKTTHNWAITDDTQLTVITCEAIAENHLLTPEILAAKFVAGYKQRKLSGLGASTLKALRELEVGGHWALVGRSGEYAAGNGAAMRIAPFAFIKSSRDDVRDFCRITHKNDEAYSGALAVVLAIRTIIEDAWSDDQNLLEIIIPELPDTGLRDRLIEINQLPVSSIQEVAKLGSTGYVVDSIPFAIFAASQIKKKSFETIIYEVISAGGDTDTNASITGQIAGSYLTIDKIPSNLLNQLIKLSEYSWINKVIINMSHKLEV